MRTESERSTIEKFFNLLVLSLMSTAATIPANLLADSWEPQGPPSWGGLATGTIPPTFTKAGITYVGLTGTFDATCARVRSTNAVLNGTNFTQSFVYEKHVGEGVICPFVLTPSEYRKVEPLGALPAGGYKMTWKSFTGTPAVTNTFAEFTFTVPPQTEPLVRLVQNPLAIAVTAAPLARYVLETSNNLTNWTSLSTNVAPSLTNSATDLILPLFYYSSNQGEVPFNEIQFPLNLGSSANSHFYRVQVLTGESVVPQPRINQFPGF